MYIKTKKIKKNNNYRNKIKTRIYEDMHIQTFLRKKLFNLCIDVLNASFRTSDQSILQSAHRLDGKHIKTSGIVANHTKVPPSRVGVVFLLRK